ncbi:hypothetical protein FIT70_04300 [Candidatus Methylopumilus universalis]|uniref:hypothetical protein n=1 Tax=Candidatus Methylopumilus universalis TaxID=2588536 RepID=UPI001124060E|nr:hypothetical protein [Candidatus Methylopumilus universalis]QDC99133.1 hypothetical protein FIT70_04300 [Candidatus Methylopumilus universalis]
MEKLALGQTWCKALYIKKQKENIGCAKSVIKETSSILKKYKAAIILEDDNYLSPYFYDYLTTALRMYAEDIRVMEISGYRYPCATKDKSSLFINGSAGWGWGTWARAWSKYEMNGIMLKNKILKDKNYINNFTYGKTLNAIELLDKQINKEIGGWDILWHGTIVINNGLTLIPAKSLVRNIGHDGSGTNSGITKKWDVKLSKNKIEDYPDTISPNETFQIALKKYFYTTNRSFKHYILNQITRISKNWQRSL